EKALVQESENHLHGFESLTKLGVKLGISHYGSGHSPLNSLLFLPIQALKLDENITQRLRDEQHIKLLSAYQKAAASLELYTFVDGLHTPEQVRLFHELGYAFGQGGALTSERVLTPESTLKPKTTLEQRLASGGDTQQVYA
ncbi:MAG: EAL domain-containing protein, partial [Shewanella sp.]